MLKIFKTTLIVATTLFFSLAAKKSSAQVSYEDTMVYLINTFKDLEKLSKKYNDQYTYYISDLEFGPYAIDKNRISFTFKRNFSDNTSDKIQVIFNPKHISVVNKPVEKSTDGFHFAEIKLTGQLALKLLIQSSIKETSEGLVSIPYIAGDSKAFARIKAAFENLKLIALVRDSQDPFAN